MQHSGMYLVNFCIKITYEGHKIGYLEHYTKRYLWGEISKQGSKQEILVL